MTRPHRSRRGSGPRRPIGSVGSRSLPRRKGCYRSNSLVQVPRDADHASSGRDSHTGGRPRRRLRSGSDDGARPHHLSSAHRAGVHPDSATNDRAQAVARGALRATARGMRCRPTCRRHVSGVPAGRGTRPRGVRPRVPGAPGSAGRPAGRAQGDAPAHREAERLARLQHTNVVPVYSVHDAPPVQVICMPYLGRTHHRRSDPRRTASTTPSRHERAEAHRRTARLARRHVVDSAPGPKSAATIPQRRSHQRRLAWPPTDRHSSATRTRCFASARQLAAGLGPRRTRAASCTSTSSPPTCSWPTPASRCCSTSTCRSTPPTADRELVGGTMPYMAIEQLLDMRTRGRGQIDARTDLYSLGVMAFEMLTGTVPFPASSKDLIDIDGLIEQRRQRPPSRPRAEPRGHAPRSRRSSTSCSHPNRPTATSPPTICRRTSIGTLPTCRSRSPASLRCGSGSASGGGATPAFRVA